MTDPFIYNKNSTGPRKSSSLSSLADTLRGKGKFVTVASVFGLLMAVALTTQQVLLQQQTRSNASYTNGANLSMATVKQTVAPNEEFDINVMIDSPTLQLSGADVTVDVPPQFQVVSVAPGGFLPVAIVTPTITPNSARFVYVSELTKPKNGSGLLAIIHVKAIALGKAQLAFSSLSTDIAAVGIENQNVANKLSPITIDVSNSTYASPTPGYASPTPVKISPTGNDADLPSVSFKSPANGTKLPTYGSVQFQVDAYSLSGIKEIKIYDNGKVVRTCLSATSCTLWYSPTKGTHTMLATVLSNSAKSSSSSITVTR